MSRISNSMSSFVIGGPALPGIEVFPFTALCLLKSSFSIRSDPAKSTKWTFPMRSSHRCSLLSSLNNNNNTETNTAYWINHQGSRWATKTYSNLLDSGTSSLHRRWESHGCWKKILFSAPNTEHCTLSSSILQERRKNVSITIVASWKYEEKYKSDAI